LPWAARTGEASHLDEVFDAQVHENGADNEEKNTDEYCLVWDFCVLVEVWWL
tara:strand:- start:315 stop:470 length:156 start_codon:yes stop_codon:yes gene_type:complete